MAKFVINNLVYDTKKMKRVAKLKNAIRHYWEVYNASLYKSKKGRYLLTYRIDSRLRYEAIDEDTAIDLLLKYNYDAYRTLFGDLEEA